MRDRHGRSKVGLLTSLTVAVVVLTGCTGAATPEEQAANQELVDEVAASVETLDAVTSVDATYADDATASAQVAAEIRCDGCDGGVVGEAFVEAVWTSRITPLGSITVIVSGERDGTASSTRVVLPRDEDATVAAYGKRPVASTTDGSTG